ncbi:MAG: D-glycero-beta-D-manno-heptose-7-phosphate kinase [Bacteroidetes bacterium]|nr:D-glycero-beta-D-manno-heptose-7-phosphate kinase [Bacteroidota bacterium]
MLNISQSRLMEIKSGFKNKKIAIVGDLMLDGYYWGDVKRISPEAPVPVIDVDEEFFRFGGAANVAYNLEKLGAIPYPVGVIGDDNDAVIFNQLMEKENITSSGIIIDPSRPTTTKTRVIGGNQHVVRIDKESKKYVDADIQSKIIANIKNMIDELDGIILQDYNKGVLTPEVISEVIKMANKKDIIITVDPKFNNFFEFKNATVFKPNRKETEDALGIRLDSEEDILKAGESLYNKLNSKYTLITLSEKGLALFDGSKRIKNIPTKARKVLDVSGAGDTVISTLTVALTAGAEIYEAAYLANYAGGLVCEEVGIVPIELDRLFDTIESLI